MKLFFKILFVVCIVFFGCKKKRECKNMSEISGDIVDSYSFWNYTCYNPESDAEGNVNYTKNINGKYFFYNDSIFDIYLNIINDTINYFPSQCVKPKVDFSKYSLLGFWPTYNTNKDMDVCYVRKQVKIDHIKKTVDYFIYNCSGFYCRLETFDTRWWVLIPKIDNTYKINYIYEEL